MGRRRMAARSLDQIAERVVVLILGLTQIGARPDTLRVRTDHDCIPLPLLEEIEDTDLVPVGEIGEVRQSDLPRLIFFPAAATSAGSSPSSTNSMTPPKTSHFVPLPAVPSSPLSSTNKCMSAKIRLMRQWMDL